MEDDEPVGNEEQFWDELDDIVSTPCRTHDRIDDTLRTWISFITVNREPFVQSEHAILRVSYALLASSLFDKNDEYIRRQITYSLLQEDDALSLHLASAFLLLDGRRHETTFELMNREGAFPHLVRLIRAGTDDDLGLHRHLLELLYEMSRIQQISWKHLTTVDDEFVLYLFQIIEGHSDDAGDPYHYPVIRALLILNEQYMITTHDSTAAAKGTHGSVTNRVIKTISLYGGSYKTFGENIILVLNRESETSVQFLILKLLYLLFTTPSTQEYFYTNDLYVLIDILIRNLLDLPPTSTLEPHSRTDSLRHTYLRVLHPLLAHTQLRHPPHYKEEELRRTLHILAEAGTHFEQPDDTTLRLVGRCLNVEWLKETEVELAAPAAMAVAVAEAAEPTAASDAAELHAEAGPDKPLRPPSGDSEKPANGHGAPPAPPVQRRAAARRKLGLQLPEAQASTLSVHEVAAQTAKPGVLTPSRSSKPRLPVPVPARRTRDKKSPFEDA